MGGWRKRNGIGCEWYINDMEISRTEVTLDENFLQLVYSNIKRKSALVFILLLFMFY